MDIEQGAEGQPIIPRAGEVPDINSLVAGCFPLAPQEEALFGRETLLIDIGDGESENEGPDQAENDLPISIHDVFGTNVGQLYASAFYEVQALVHVLELLDSQLRLCSVSAK